MIALIDAERIKLFSTRAAWWCLALVAVSTVGVGALGAAYPIDGGAGTITDTQLGYFLAQVILIVLAVVSISGEHRFGTIRLSYLATPRRWRLLLAKTATLGIVTLAVGTALSFLSVGVAALAFPDGDFAVRTPTDWRIVAGLGLGHTVSVVIAVAVAALLRHAAGAVSLLLVWTLIIETTVPVLPYGDVTGPLLPFRAQSYFLGQISGEFPYPPVFGICYAAAFAAALLGLAMLVVERRDAA